LWEIVGFKKGEKTMTHSTYIQKLVVGDIITGIEEKSIYKVITPRRIDIDQKTNKRKLVNDKEIHNWHFVNKSFKDLPKQLTKNAIEIDKVTITLKQFNWICFGQILIGEHFFN
jgi:septum formation inhibitor-activating ATPase MinD